MVTDHFFVLQPCNRHYGNPRVENINTKSSSPHCWCISCSRKSTEPPIRTSTEES